MYVPILRHQRLGVGGTVQPITKFTSENFVSHRWGVNGWIGVDGSGIRWPFQGLGGLPLQGPGGGPRERSTRQ